MPCISHLEKKKIIFKSREGDILVPQKAKHPHKIHRITTKTRYLVKPLDMKDQNPHLQTNWALEPFRLGSRRVEIPEFPRPSNSVMDPMSFGTMTPP